jgi:hypothetical protein
LSQLLANALGPSSLPSEIPFPSIHHTYLLEALMGSSMSMEPLSLLFLFKLTEFWNLEFGN